MKIKIEFISHSGVAVSEGDRFLLFDYYRGGLPREEVRAAAHPLVLSSHSHFDHFNPEILSLAEDNPDTQFVLSYDISAEAEGAKLHAGQSARLDGAEVHAYPSTDLGCSYLVRADGIEVFHAGDLNLWSWKDESSEKEVFAAKHMFLKALDSIEDMRPDIAFFPYDSRMGTDFGEGLMVFIERFRPRYLMPIHFWDDFSVLRTLEDSIGDTRILKPVRCAQEMEIVI